MGFTEGYTDIIKLWFGPKLLVGIYNPNDIELVLGSNVHLTKSQEYTFFEPWFGNGLLISKGETWQAHRKMIAPTFHLNVLKRFMKQFNVRGRGLVTKMKKEIGNEFDCHDYMSECTVETLVETVMGVKECFQGNAYYNYAEEVMEMCGIIHSRHSKLWLRSDLLFKLFPEWKKHNKLLASIHRFTNKVFYKKKEAVVTKKPSTVTTSVEEENAKEIDAGEKYSFGHSSGIKDDIDDNEIGAKKRSPFLESLIERSLNDDGITEQEVINQVNTIMFEGHDTTAAGSSFFLCAMAVLPEIQARCHEEIDAIFGDSDRDVTFEDTLQMKYTERCIMEALRMFPPVPLIARQLEQELKLILGNYTVPAGCTVGIATIKLHRRPDIYKNPDEFNPDNFLPENSASRHYYGFIPFSAGPRSCVGRKYAMLKLKVILAHILRKYRIAGGKPMDQWELQADIILKRGDGFKIRLVPRS
ncbi:hypothetical protein AAG570_005761 [Ranatra chinensis]|uniref:Cytochrome P450 n=1 Tax=Ranatra chinensis TaxID=642074 RepID=A0ABD0XYH1_9HEMI